MAAELEADPQYAKLGYAVRSALVAQSCVADIRQAVDCCAALRSVLGSPRKIGTIERLTIESSLLANAVMLYARATATAAKDGERGAIKITPKMTTEQRADHDILVTIRNRALAHVYTAEPIDGELWHQAVLFAVETEGTGWRPAAGSRRVQNNLSTLERLERQLPVAHAMLTAKSRKRIDAITGMLNDDPLPLATFERFQFDPVERFGSAEAVQTILRGQAVGEASALTR
jgi:hypothetical protein